MIIYDSCRSAVQGMERFVDESGVDYISRSVSGLPDGRVCREVLGFQGLLTGWEDRDSVREELGEKNFRFLEKEFEEWVSGKPTNPGLAWKEDPDTWAPFLTEEGKFSYTYSSRFTSPPIGSPRYPPVVENQIETAISLLEADWSTRRAMVSIWDNKDIFPPCDALPQGPENRVPCTIGYHFLMRPSSPGDDRYVLKMIYMMRSLNVSWNLWNDLYLVTNLFEYVRERLTVKASEDNEFDFDSKGGEIQLFANSLHKFSD